MREGSWQDAIANGPSEQVSKALTELYQGHQRFLQGKPKALTYSVEQLREIATDQKPIAAIVACSDSRVAPEIVFDQPLGSVFASRVPGNVASDSAKWMLDMAVKELRVPLVIVLGHTGCRAVGELMEGKVEGAGGALRSDIQMAVHKARMSERPDVYKQAVIENVGITIENLKRESYAVQKAIEQKALGLFGAYYDMPSGKVHLLF